MEILLKAFTHCGPILVYVDGERGSEGVRVGEEEVRVGGRGEGSEDGREGRRERGK